MPPHPLTNFEIQKYYQNEPNFNGVFSRNNLSFFFYRYIINIHLNNTKTVSPSTNILRVPGKNIKRNP